MKQSQLHVAIIMDGNGRWAQQFGEPRLYGHTQGGEVLHQLIQGLATLPLDTLTLYCFSQDNWQRPASEVEGLWQLFFRFIEQHRSHMQTLNARFNVIGRRDRIPLALKQEIEDCEQACVHHTGILVRLAIDYSARYSLERVAQGWDSSLDFTTQLEQVQHGMYPVTSVDILIRTGGEQRLSDFLLFESAYAELFFLKKHWPDFSLDDLTQILDTFSTRQRRFGGLLTATKE